MVTEVRIGAQENFAIEAYLQGSPFVIGWGAIGKKTDGSFFTVC